MYVEGVNWSVFVGVPKDIAERNRDKIVVPANTVLAYLTGELTKKRAKDDYNVSIKREYDKKGVFVCTPWLSENRFLMGSVGFFVNASCSENRLVDVIDEGDLNKVNRDASRDILKFRPTYGLFLQYLLARDLKGKHFIEPPGEKDSPMYTCTVAVDEKDWLLLPVEAQYYCKDQEQALKSGAKKPKQKKQPKAAKTRPSGAEDEQELDFECNCLTRCWRSATKHVCNADNTQKIKQWDD